MPQRIETDSMGEVLVDSQALWGAETQRSLKHFNIGSDRMPRSVIRAFGLLKQACAEVNGEKGLLPHELVKSIQEASVEIIKGELDEHFPLRIWQTGSGTQTNMNLNEVIANRAAMKAGHALGSKKPLDPHSHVNMSQSSNDTFPTAMHIAAVEELVHVLIPALESLQKALDEKSQEFASIVKMGRTHLMDAVPLTLGQEFSAYAFQLNENIRWIKETLPNLYALAIGGTAVGTGLNAPKDFGEKVAANIAAKTDLPFYSSPNKFASLASHEPFVLASGALKTLACALMKIANDIRWMGSGPRAGLSELFLPANEPGSSIMPGKVNPTQCEALTMICIQVMGNDTSITIADSQGNFELNVFKPLIIHNFLQSTRLLADGCRSFTEHLVKGLKANTKNIKQHLDQSLMLITALSPLLGYETCARIAQQAYLEERTLKDVCVSSGLLTAEEFDQKVRPENMIKP